MLLSFRSDRPFEQAAHSDEACDKLLRWFQRVRRFTFIFGLVSFSAALVPVIWWSIRINRIMNSLESPTALSDIKAIVSEAAPFAFPFLMIAGLLTASILHSDVCIKMLLLIRGKQTRQAAAGKE